MLPRHVLPNCPEPERSIRPYQMRAAPYQCHPVSHTQYPNGDKALRIASFWLSLPHNSEWRRLDHCYSHKLGPGLLTHTPCPCPVPTERAAYRTQLTWRNRDGRWP